MPDKDKELKGVIRSSSSSGVLSSSSTGGSSVRSSAVAAVLPCSIQHLQQSSSQLLGGYGSRHHHSDHSYDHNQESEPGGGRLASEVENDQSCYFSQQTSTTASAPVPVPAVTPSRSLTASISSPSAAFHLSPVGPSSSSFRLIHSAKGAIRLSADEKDIHSDVTRLSPKVRQFVENNISLCEPDRLHICDGSEEEYNHLINVMLDGGMIEPLPKYQNCWLARTDPADVARVESRTFISTSNERDVIPAAKLGLKSQLGNWMSLDDLHKSAGERFPKCMKGRTMYVIPFSMGPVGSPLSKIGIEITDSPYVVASMRIMTRMGSSVLDSLGDGDFVRCLHSVGAPFPLERPVKNCWPCNPERTLILQCPSTNDILSYGSGYGGNSLLGKKCFALRIGSTIAKKEGWLAEHMLILGITNPEGEKRYIAAAFPSACGKTNLAMMSPTLPGYKVECVGDDIAWMKFDSNGILRAINPENGFFGVAPGTSNSTNPNAMRTIFKNTIFTNVGKTSDGGVFWEGMEREPQPATDEEISIKTWTGDTWSPDGNQLCAHPNSRFCSPANQCPIIDPAWEDPEGVPISAILFGGRRPKGVPLVYEAFSWQHGVFIGAAMRSESTAAAEHKGKVIMHDPFAMRPFFGYNFGQYLDHWLSMENRTAKEKLPKIFHVNWFRKGPQGNFLWPGFGENSRVLDWIFRRVANVGKETEVNDSRGSDALESAIGYLPKPGSFNLNDLNKSVDMTELFSIPKEFWIEEVAAIRKYFSEEIGADLPAKVAEELVNLEKRIHKL